MWDACSDAGITLEGLRSTTSSNLAFSVENDRLVQALHDTIDEKLEPQSGSGQTLSSDTRTRLERVYGVHITKYVFPSAHANDSQSQSLPPVELELSDGRKLSTSLLVCFFPVVYIPVSYIIL